MDYALGNMVVHIHWVIAKPLPGWEDIRQTVSGHTFYYIYSGKGTFRCEESDLEVSGGTLVYLWPGLPLYMKSSDAHPLRMTMILFDCASLIKNENEWDTPKSIERLRLPFIMPLQSERAGRIGEQFREAEREWVPGDLVRETRVKSVWYRLVQEVHEAAEAGGRHNDGDGIVEALRKFKEKLDTAFATELRITEVIPSQISREPVAILTYTSSVKRSKSAMVSLRSSTEECKEIDTKGDIIRFAFEFDSQQCT